MAAYLVSRLLPVALGVLLAGPTLPELFQKAKQEFKLGSYGNALATLEKLETESSEPGLERDREALLPGLLFYKGACQAALGQQQEASDTFQAFLVLKPDVRLDPAIYPKSVIAALESARKAAAHNPDVKPAGEAGMIRQAYRAFVPPLGHADDSVREEWADGPVRWIMTVSGIDQLAVSTAAGEGMSTSDFLACYLRDESFGRVVKDLEEGYRLGVNSTPTYFIDGTEITWIDDTAMEDYLRTIFPKTRTIDYGAKK